MLAGFGNHHQTEAIENALPKTQNSPQHCPFGLYAEQVSGSAFTRPRHNNLRSWLYRILPSVAHTDYSPYNKGIDFFSFNETQPPNPFRWSPQPPLTNKKNFIEGLFYLAGNRLQHTFVYQCNQSMQHCYFSNNDGEMLFVPYEGELQLHTEFGVLNLVPGHIAVIPRGVKFKVQVLSKKAEGYLCENGSFPFTLPQLGPIGANGLANPRHFIYPEASFEPDLNQHSILICKYQNQFWQANSDHSPLNVVAWQGNYAPYTYNLSLFNTINTVSFDHPDPSIFTVLTAESNMAGVAHLDFVIFPPRWMVAEHTFRPPYFHRNVMNEFMGLLQGKYDAKQSGFAVGGVSIHNGMVGHGPDRESVETMTQLELEPHYYGNTLAFMFESKEPWLISHNAYKHPTRQLDYTNCWQNIKVNFNPLSE